MLRAERVRRAIRPMVLPSEVLERRALFTVNPTAFLPQIVTQYWGYTDTMYEGDLTVNTTTSASASTVTLSDGTYTYDYIDTYVESPPNSSGDFTWSVNDWETQLWSLTDTRTDSAGYFHTTVSYIFETSTETGSGVVNTAGDSTTLYRDDTASSAYIDTATKGTQTITENIHNYSDWHRSGSGTAALETPITFESLLAYSALGSGSGSTSGGTNTFSDVVTGSPTALNEQGGEKYYLSASASQSTAGITSNFTISASGYENLNLVTTVSAARVVGGTGTDYSYLDNVASNTYSYSESGGSSPSGSSGTFNLVSSGSNWAIQTVWGSGTSGSANDSYYINDDNYSVFNEGDSGTVGPVKSDTIYDNTISSDVIISSGSGTSVRPGSLNGTGTDSYSFNGSTVLDKGQFASGSTPAVYDSLTSGFNATGTFSSAVLDDSGTDTETIKMWGSGSGTVEQLYTSSSSGSGIHNPVSDSYSESETRVRSYDLLDNIMGSGSMSSYDDTSDSASGSGGFAGYNFSFGEYDMDDINTTLSSTGVYAFNMSASGFGPGGSYTESETGNNSGVITNSITSNSASGTSPTGVYGSVEYDYIGNAGTFNSFTSATVQRVGGQWTLDSSGVTAIVDGSPEDWDSLTSAGQLSYLESNNEAHGVSDPIATANNLNSPSLYLKTGFITMDTPLDTIQDLAWYSAQYGRTQSILYIMPHDVSGGGNNPYNYRTDESELVSPNNTSGLPSQGLTFLDAVITDLATGGVVTFGADNTEPDEQRMLENNEITQSNGFYAAKTHIYFDPGYFTPGFYLTRTAVRGDPFAE